MSQALPIPRFGTAPGGFPWASFNEDIFEAVSDHSSEAPHLCVRARAGSGKTTTGVHALGLTSPRSRVLACAFNVDIAKVLTAKLERSVPWADARTFHSAGMGAITSALGRAKVRGTKELPISKVKLIARDLCPEEARFQPSYVSAIERVVSLAKCTLTPAVPFQLSQLATRYHIDGAPEAWTPERDRWAVAAATVLGRCAKWNGEIDFDDMCWLPVHLNLPVRAWDFVLADEAQDLNACQHELVKKLVGKRGRLLAIGDDRQAIYQFRGASEGSFDQLADHFDAQVLPLSVCYRCDAKIIELAKEIVPDLEARPGAPDGIVRDVDPETMLFEAEPGDFVLSRTKAPLLGTCLQLIAEGKPATIVGRDIATGLTTMIKKSKADSVEDLKAWLRMHQAKAFESMSQDEPEAYEEIADRIACVFAVISNTNSVGEVLAKIDRLFTDAGDDGGYSRRIRLSTTHKAKGLEADRVFLLADTYRKRPGLAEDNLWYVAVTRAKRELVLVYGDEPEPSSKGGA